MPKVGEGECMHWLGCDVACRLLGRWLVTYLTWVDLMGITWVVLQEDGKETGRQEARG
jgi:hypothetical protein